MFEKNEVLDTEQTDRPEYVSVVHALKNMLHVSDTDQELAVSTKPPPHLAIGREAAAGAGKGAIN